MITTNTPPGEMKPVTPVTVVPTVTNPPTTKAAPKRYEDCADLIRGALTDPAQQVEVLQQLKEFFDERIRGVKNTRTKEGFGAVKDGMEKKWSRPETRTPSTLIGAK